MPAAELVSFPTELNLTPPYALVRCTISLVIHRNLLEMFHMLQTLVHHNLSTSAFFFPSVKVHASVCPYHSWSCPDCSKYSTTCLARICSSLSAPLPHTRGTGDQRNAGRKHMDNYGSSHTHTITLSHPNQNGPGTEIQKTIDSLALDELQHVDQTEEGTRGGGRGEAELLQC